MKSFRITTNNHVSITLNSFYNNVILTQIDNHYHLLMYVRDEKNRFEWEAKILEEGDLINIKVLNLDSGTVPQTTIAEDLTSIKEGYQYLKLELEKEGII